MAEIKLTKGKVTIIDDEDFDYLNQWKWYYNSGYAVRGFPKRILMHRLINKTPIYLETDHINRNKLDNRKSNLRNVTSQENNFNTTIRKDNTSGIKGVWWHDKIKRWRVQLNISGIRLYFGSYTNLSEAISVRKDVEKIYHAI